MKHSPRMTAKEIAREVVTVWDGENRDELRSVIHSAIEYERQDAKTTITELVKALKMMLEKFEHDTLPGESGWDAVEAARAALEKAGAL